MGRRRVVSCWLPFLIAHMSVEERQRAFFAGKSARYLRLATEAKLARNGGAAPPSVGPDEPVSNADVIMVPCVLTLRLDAADGDEFEGGDDEGAVDEELLGVEAATNAWRCCGSRRRARWHLAIQEERRFVCDRIRGNVRNDSQFERDQSTW